MSHWHIFSLPPELIETLVPRTLHSQPASSAPVPEVPEPTEKQHAALSCAVCLGVRFQDVDEQRAHVRSDWHRYNVKTRLAGGKAVDEPAFAQLVSALDDSLSGSASSDDNEGKDEGDKSEDQDTDAVNTLVNRTKKLLKTTITTSDEEDTRTTKRPLTSLTWFHSPPSTQIGVYRAVFSAGTDPQEHLNELKGMQEGERERKWALFMTAGGHFAGAIVRVSRSSDVEEGESKAKKKKPKQDMEVLRHKTFHRYTTRRKQGGSQSVNDNAKGAAISAGAMLRRYGEQALRDDIRNLLGEWAEDIDECERIWIRASVSNRRIFLDYEEAVIQKGDERLRTFPFPTRRPTQSEVQRCLFELTRVKVTHFTEDALRAQDEAYFASLPQPRPRPPAPQPEAEKVKTKVAKLSKEEEVLREKWSRLLEMIIKGRLEVLKLFWEREGETLGGVNAAIPDWTGEKRTRMLQVATQSGHEEVAQWMLEELRADPTITVGGRTAYELATNKAVRDVFRRCAAAHSEWWDWFGTARVPSALSKEMEDERDTKRRERRKGLKDKLRERVKEEEVVVEVPAVAAVDGAPAVEAAEATDGGRRLGGMAGSAEGVAGLSAEMRGRVERERRARAAEARLRTASGGNRI
ncbi:hypothetical protein APHAL10511_002200 [Amanita phalloides]|nr:hypothetical protein APHAL10511_002200 [Amanita phalloides]